ncbi:hypothetical protein LTR95_015108 [Oleoguttula sp. CCFEE 5521]
MYALTTLLAAQAALICQSNALQLRRPSHSGPKVIQHQIQRRHVADPVKQSLARLRRRAGTVTAELDNEGTLYFMDISIGTPAQDLHMHIDTGSSDLWVNVPNSQLCTSQQGICSASGTYDSSASSTYKLVNNDFNISYVDGSGSSGNYVTDVVSFSDITLDNQQFGVGLVSSSMEGVLGIGYVANEVAASSGSTYSNIPKNLVNSGHINTNAYSLWLNDLDASMGSILFGGVNTAKYTGELETLPIIPTQGFYAEFIVAMTAVGMNGTKGSVASNIASPALLDSGSSLMYLPDQIANDIFSALGTSYDSQQGAAIVNCDLINSDATIDFTFSSPTISVPMNELVFIAGGTNSDPICILGIGPAGSSTPVLGDTFLRSAYVVYDLQNNEISLAQTNFNSTDNNILEISSGATSVPSATNVANPVTQVSVETGGARLGGFSSVIGGTASSAGIAAPTAFAVSIPALVGAVAAAALAL